MNQVRRKVSAGLMMYRLVNGRLEVFLVHPGGPFFRNKDEGAWSIPKGEVEGDDDLLATARREFEEEIGFEPAGDFLPLGEVRQRGGKVVHGWAFQGDRNADEPIRCNTVSIEWPPRSGRQQEFPEIDKAEFFDLETARRKINPAQVALINRLESVLSAGP